MTGLVGALLREPPLDPGGDEARGELRRELARPEYYDRDLLGRLVAWVQRLVDDTIAAASGAPPLGVALAVLVALLLLTATMLLVSRARRSVRAVRSRGAVLGTGSATAAEVRARAEAALAAGDPAGAVVDAYRALALRQVEGGHLPDLPQATALEVAQALAALYPAHAPALRRGADGFDEVLYGDHPADAEQARSLFDLDDTLAGVRA